MATVGSCIGWLQKLLKQRKSEVVVRMAPPYHDHPTYIEPIAEKLKRVMVHLFSYHGIPERHLKKADPTGKHCMKCNDCCNVPNPDAHAVYRQQCFATTHAIVQAAGLPDDRWRVTFNLASAPTSLTSGSNPIPTKPCAPCGEGIKRLAVLCPAFFCDCLETLEEIEEEGKEIFMEAGGESYRMIPCLNHSPAGVHCLETLMHDAAQWPVQA